MPKKKKDEVHNNPSKASAKKLVGKKKIAKGQTINKKTKVSC